MDIKFTTELDYKQECFTLLSRLIAPSKAEGSVFNSFDDFRKKLSGQTHMGGEIEDIFTRLEDAAKDILSGLDISGERLRFYFTPFHEDISLAALYINAEPLFSLPDGKRQAMLCREILSSLLSELFDAEGLPENENQLLSYLEDLPVSAEAKWSSLLFFRNYGEYAVELRPVFAQAEALLREKLPFFSPYISRELDKIKAGVSKNGAGWLEERYHINPNSESFTVGISLMQYDGIEVRASNALLDGCERNISFRVGILVNPIMARLENKSLGDENLLRALKTLNDKNRLQILRLLKRSPLCGQEIAEQLGISPATVSHHMNELASRNFVTLDRAGAKINYRLSAAGIQAFLDELQKSLL